MSTANIGNIFKLKQGDSDFIAPAHYEPAIDGLRAAAVIAVVLYHARVSVTSSGFAGVDVFFAISGYLVVGMLLAEQIRTSSIDWSDFFVRRARRLLPMLWLTIVASLAAGYWLLSPFGDFQELSKMALSALVSSANLYAWRYQGNYFNSQSDQLPLIHLWSLSVEEQFYLSLPLFFLLIRWLKPHQLIRFLSALTAISFLIAIWRAQAHPISTFYLPVTRVWEFGIGALAATQRGIRASPIIRLLLLIGLLSCFTIPFSNEPWSLACGALAATLCAALLSVAKTADERDFAMLMLRHPAAVWVGRRAYCWYLMHWPALVFYRSYWLEDVSTLELIAVALISLAFSGIAYRFVELPCRYGGWRPLISKHRISLIALLGSMVLVTAIFRLYVDSGGWQDQARWKAHGMTALWMDEAAKCLRNPYILEVDALPCVDHPSSESTTTILWGDSHAYHLRPALNEVVASQNTKLITWSMAACPPLLNWDGGHITTLETRAPCRNFRQQASKNIAEATSKGSVIAILAARWEYYLAEAPISAMDIQHSRKVIARVDPIQEQVTFAAALSATVEDLSKQGLQVVLVAPIPEQRVVASYCYTRFAMQRCRTARELNEQYRATTMKILRTIASKNANVQIVDPINVFCDAQTCEAEENGDFWYIDDDHLSVIGSKKLVPILSFAVATAKHQLANP